MDRHCPYCRNTVFNKIYYSERFLYWSEWNDVAGIKRISLDGDPATLQVLMQREYSRPNGLVIDLTIPRLFWLDQKRLTLETSLLNGENHHVLVYLPLKFQPFHLAIFEEKAYWVDMKTRSIMRMNKYGRGKTEALISNQNGEVVLKFYHPLLQSVGMLLMSCLKI